MITKVGFENFRGTTGRISIPGLRTLLSGRNGSGKTTIMEGVQFALTGKIPGESEKDRDIWAANATDDQMSTMVDGLVPMHGIGYGVIRTLTRAGKVTRHSGVVNGKDYKKPEMQLAIRNAGAEFDIVDAAGFFKLSNAKQIEYLCSFYSGDEYTTEKILAMFKSVADGKFEANITPFETISVIDSRIKTIKSSSTATIKSADATIASLSEQRAQVQRPSGTVTDIQREMLGIENSLNMIRDGLPAIIAAKTNYDAWKVDLAKAADNVKIYESLNPPSEEECNKRITEIVQKKAVPNKNQALADKMNDVLRAMDDSGCEACSVKLLVKRIIREATPEIDYNEVEKLQDEHNRALSDLRNRQELDRAKKNHEKLLKDDRQNGVTENQEEQSAAAAGMETSLAELREQEKSFSRITDLTESIEKIRLGKIKAEESLENAKKAEKKLKALRSKVIEAVFSPVRQAIDSYLPSGFSFVTFDENEALSIGWKLVGREHGAPFTSLSGGEGAMFLPAFGLGLISLRPSENQKILLIETGEVDSQNLFVFCDALNKTPDNVQIIAATHLEAKEVEGWEVVELTGG